MSKFSEYLEEYLKKKEITIASLASRLNMDRSIMYRYVKGTRIPIEDTIVKDIANALFMTLSEKGKLLELYERQIYGDDNMDNYFAFRNFLAELKVRKNEFGSKNNIWKTDIIFNENIDVMWLNSREEISTMVRYVLNCLGKSEVGNEYIYIVMQPNHESVQRYLRPYLEGSNVVVEQIVCLEQGEKYRYKNLDVMLNIIGTCFGKINYTVYYYYGNENNEHSETKWMTNVIITAEYVIQFDDEMKCGSVIKDKDYANGALIRYRSIKKRTRLLKKNVEFGNDMTDFYGNEIDGYVNSTLFFEPCVAPAIGDDIYKANLYDFPGKEEFLKRRGNLSGVWNNMVYFPTKQIEKNALVIHFQYSGLIKFMETGRTSEFPSVLYKELDMNQRILTLRRMIELNRRNLFQYSLVDESVEIPENIYIYHSKEFGMLQFNMYNEDYSSQFVIRESGFGYAFEMYIETLDRKGFIKSQEETMAVMEEVCLMYESRV